MFLVYPTPIVPFETVAMKDSLSYQDVPIEIFYRYNSHVRVYQLRFSIFRIEGWEKKVISVKVLWRSQSVEWATWEAEAFKKSKYPYIFPSNPNQDWGNISVSFF